jgi:hypothetical protein
MAQTSWKLLITHVHMEASTQRGGAKVTSVIGSYLLVLVELTERKEKRSESDLTPTTV